MWLEAHAMGYGLWGLDQEFMGAGRFLLNELDGLVEDRELRPQIGQWRKMATEGFQLFVSSGDESRGFLIVVDPEELEAYGKRLPAESREARRIVEELRQTAIVYQHFRDERYFLNNRDRVKLMKRHLATYIDEAGGLEAMPKTLFKFGSVHMGRGYSPMYQLDLGNAAAELAAARGSDVDQRGSGRNAEGLDRGVASPGPVRPAHRKGPMGRLRPARAPAVLRLDEAPGGPPRAGEARLSLRRDRYRTGVPRGDSDDRPAVDLPF